MNQEPNTEAGKPYRRLAIASSLRRLRRIVTEQRSEIANLQQEVQHLKSAVSAENRKVDDLQKRLRSIVNLDVNRERLPSDIVTMCLRVNAWELRMCRTNAIWEEAMRQLVTDLEYELSGL